MSPLDIQCAPATPRSGDAGVVDPLVVALGLGLVGALGGGLVAAGVPLPWAERVTAAAFLLLAAGLTLRSVTNGVVLLFLLPPLFDGETQRPWFLLLEAVLALTLLRGFAPCLWRRQPLHFPGAPVFVLFLASTIISLPLDLRELWLEVQVTPWTDLFTTLGRGALAGRLAYLRTVVNVASGIALYVLVASCPWPRELLHRLATATTVVLAAVVTLGLVLYSAAPRPGRIFLTVWLGGRLNAGFPGLGFNVSYFAQYAVAYLPLVGLVVAERRASSARALAVATLPLGCYGILLTRQRGAWLVLALEVLFLLAAGLYAWRAGWPDVRARLVLGAVGAAIVIVTALLLLSPLGESVRSDVLVKWREGDAVRTHLLEVTGGMVADQPLLGIGSGRFFDLFHLYSSRPAMQFGSWSAHNLYAQLLAEQGILGLASFLALVAVALGPAIRAVRHGEASPAAGFLLISLGAWLAYGLLQYTFLLRAMQLYVWIALGLLAALSPVAHRVRPAPRRWLAAGSLALVVVLGVRIAVVMHRPVAAEWGFYPLEGQMRWIGGGAWLTVPVQGQTLRLTVAGPDPRLTGRPQRLDLRLDGARVARVSLDAPGWRIIDIPVNRPPGSQVLLQLGVAYTFVPAAFGLNDDVRPLGVALQPIVWVES